MLQYLFNTSCIWLTGLIAFDILLRREAHHGFNRFYLLLILFAGILIPLWSWDTDSIVYTTAVSQPIAEQTAVARAAIASNSDEVLLSWEQWLLTIYIAGVVVVLFITLKDMLNIYKLLRKGDKHKDGTWTVVETGTSISPFSAFRYVFISSRKNYSTEELAMILAHEEQHGHLLHFIDVLITRMCAVLFWFNPIVYILEKRLRMTHEYQADAAVDNYPEEYGRFLIEQSILGAAPMMAHSFTRSPLKKRIVMLTRKTTILTKSKRLIILPVLALAVVCFTKNAFSFDEPKKDGNKVTFKGNVVEYSSVSASVDTVIVVDPITGEEQMLLTRMEPSPIKINGETIYNSGSIRTPGKYGGDVSDMSNFSGDALKMYLLTNMKKELKKLNDGEYKIVLGDIVIDKEGAIAFYSFGGVWHISRDNTKYTEKEIDPDTEKQIIRKISTLIDNAPKSEPATINEKPVYCTKSGIHSRFTIKKGVLVSL